LLYLLFLNSNLRRYRSKKKATKSKSLCGLINGKNFRNSVITVTHLVTISKGLNGNMNTPSGYQNITPSLEGTSNRVILNPKVPSHEGAVGWVI